LGDSSKEPSFSKDTIYDNDNYNSNISSSFSSSFSSSNEIEESLIQNNRTSPIVYSSNNLVSEGIIAGKRIAKISVVTLLSIGVVEIVTGYLSGSVVATADGIDSYPMP
jgi:hypothetical protein